MLKKFLEITLIELPQPVAEAVHHRHEQPGRPREHPPYFVPRNAADNSICLGYRGGGSRFRIDDGDLTEVVTDPKGREHAALLGSD